jgi:hypothetical protein
VESGESLAHAAAAYQRDHPLEPNVSVSEVEGAVASAKALATKRSKVLERSSRPSSRENGSNFERGTG